MAPTTRKHKKPMAKRVPVSESEEQPSSGESEPEPAPKARKRSKKKIAAKKRLPSKKNTKPLNKLKESPEQNARRLQREAERVRRRRANETPAERERRLKVAREARKRRYQMLKETETPEEREERMRVESDVRWLQRKCETEEQRRARQRRDAERQREIRRRRYGLDRPLDWNGLRAPEPETPKKGKEQRARPKIACPVCSVMVLEDYMETHSLRHQGTSARPFRCSVCPKTYIQFAHLKEHRRRHFDTAPLEEHDFYCEVCSTIIYTRYRYISHLRHHIRKSGLQLTESEPVFLYICDFEGCQLCFRDKGRFLSHLESHSPGRSSFSCSTCKKSFAQENHCKTHMELAHKVESDNIMDCPFCHLVIENKAEDWEWHFAGHQIRLNEKPPGNHLCEGCGKTFRTAKSLGLHVRRMHETEPPLDRKPHSSKPESKLVENKSIFPCAVCGKKLSRKPELHNHMLRCHTYEHGTRCYVCEKHYEHLHTLLVHIRGNHTNEPKLTKRACCHFCDRDFSGYMMKNKHHFFAHRDEYLKTKPFCCAVCYRNFAAIEALTTHLLVHEKWKCPVCGQCQISQKMHDMHLRTHNLGPLAPTKQRNIKYRKVNRGSEFFALEQTARQRLEEVAGNHFYYGEVGHVDVPVADVPGEEVDQVSSQEDEYVPNAGLENSQKWQIVSEGGVAVDSAPVETFEQVTQPTDNVYSQDMVNEAEGAAEQEKASAAIEEESLSTNSETMPPPVPGPIIVQKKYKCDRCPRQFSFPKHLLTHISWHIGDETGNVELMTMSAESILFTEQSDSDLDKYRNPNYIDADGIPTKRYVCTECAESFSHRTNLNKHRRIIHGVLVTEPEKQYKCEYCPRTFSRESNMLKHVDVIHKEKEEPPSSFVEVDLKPFLEDGPPTPWEWGISEPEDHHSAADEHCSASDGGSEQETVKKSVAVSTKPSKVQKTSKQSKNRVKSMQKQQNRKVKQSKAKVVPSVSSGSRLRDNKFPCDQCFFSFTRESALRQHQLSHEAPVEEEEPEWILPEIKEEPQDASDMEWDGGYDAGYSELRSPTQTVAELQKQHTSIGLPSANVHRFEELPTLDELKTMIKQSINTLTPTLRDQALSLPAQLYIQLPVVEIPARKSIPEDRKLAISQKSNTKKSYTQKGRKKTRAVRKTVAKTKKSKHPRVERKKKEPKPPKPPKAPEDPNAPKKKRNVCEVCKKDFHPHTDMRVHMSTHTGDKPYVCKNCPGRVFSNQRQYREHRKKHHTAPAPTKRALFDSSEFYCDICFMTVKYKRRYDRHLRTHKDLDSTLNGVIYMYQCDACPQAFRIRERFVLHLESHSPDATKEAVACYHCSKPFAKTETLGAHLKGVHEAKETVHECDYCHRDFTTEEDLTKHLEAHAIDLSASLVGEHMCSQCGMTFLHIATLNGHIIQAHEGAGLDPRAKARVHLRKDQGGKVSHNEQAPCQVCGKKFGVRNALNNHMLKDHTYEHGLYCFVCNRKFACLGPLTRHLLDYHKDVSSSANLALPRRVKIKRTQYPCIYCPASYSADVTRLYRHYFQEHNEEYMRDSPFHCELCFKNFETVDDYNLHRPSHDKFKCHHCGKQFLRMDYLNVHMLRHQGEREYECTKCDKKFTTVYNLRDHEKRHAKEYAFFCTYCPKNTAGFYKKVHLDKHVTKIHLQRSETYETEIVYEGNSNSGSTASSYHESQPTTIITAQPIQTQTLRLIQHPIPVIQPHQYILQRHSNQQQFQDTAEEIHFTMESLLY